MKKKVNILNKYEVFILLLAIGITGFGILSIKSATFNNTGGTDYFLKQAIFAAIGMIGAIGLTFVHPRFIAASSLWMYALSILMLIAVLVFGKTINGNKSWFYIGGFGIQPSEFAKIATVLAVCFFLRYGDEKKDVNKLKVFIITAIIVIIPAGLIKLQHDTGTTIIVAFLLLPILWGAGLNSFFMFVLVSPIIMIVLAFLNPLYFWIAVVIAGLILFMFRKNLFATAIAFGVNIAAGLSVNLIFSKLAGYQQQRILAIFDPTADPLKSGYNVIQAKVAIGSGGFYGKGYLQGSQTQLRFIPEQWTDFIFCMVGEEFGFIGSSVLISLFILLILRIFFVGLGTNNGYMGLATICFASLFLIHLFINVGMTIGVMPVIGIPLPMVSYGVSSLLSFWIMIGLAMNTYYHRDVIG